MANTKQLEKLRQGVEIWNEWRKSNSSSVIDLSDANLIEADLRGADLRRANLSGAKLNKANLSGANLWKAELILASLNEANLSKSELVAADFSATFAGKANFQNANLVSARFMGTQLRDANLENAILQGAILSNTNLLNSNFQGSRISNTKFIENDLSKLIGIENVIHISPSTVDIYTLQFSKGKIPEVFLRGCGLSDLEIESAKLYSPELSNDEINKTLYKVYDLRAQQPLQISPLFISYSHADSTFVDRLEVLLNEKGIRFWRDIHAATSGRLEKQIDRAIRHTPTVLVVLSENSIKSDWVQHEVRLARGLEKESGRDVLCPVALDDSWKSSSWPERIMEQVKEYNILDFSKWDDDNSFRNMFGKLIDGLSLYYKK